jgi:ubiquinone/menaquinone biosynthesis C-methylase UbiE
LLVENITGIDLSAVYVEHARGLCRDTRLDLVVGDAFSLPFADASFDHSLSMLVLQFVPSADVALREMRRVTRSGGTIAAATWDARGGLTFFASYSIRPQCSIPRPSNFAQGSCPSA